MDEADSYRCECAVGYEGDHCETDVDECASQPCWHDGVCTEGIGTFSCECAAGYTGERCEQDIDECAPEPCLNGGTCIDGVAGYTCACAEGFFGESCGISAGSCDDQPCQNGATCVPYAFGFERVCAWGFEGTRCEDDIDEGTSALHHCGEHAWRVNTAGGYACECDEGFVGNGRSCEPEAGCGCAGAAQTGSRDGLWWMTSVVLGLGLRRCRCSSG